MNRGRQSLLVAAVVAVILAALVAWTLHVGGRTGATPSRASGARGAAAVTLSDVRTDTARENAATRLGSSPEISAPMMSATTTTAAARIRGIVVVDVGSKPIAGAAVEAWLDPAQSFPLLLHEARPPSRKLDATHTDDAGEFSLAADELRSVQLRVHADSWAPVVLDGVHAGDRVRIGLRRGASIEGVVTRASDHAPIVGADVVVWGEESTGEPTLTLTTDSMGRYRTGTLAAGGVMLQILPLDEIAVTRDFEIGPDEHKIVDVELEGGAVLSGVVSDARTQRPVEKAEVSIRNFRGKTVRTDALGRYELHGVRSPKVVDGESASIMFEINVRAVGYGGEQRRLAATGESPIRADFALQPGIVVSGRVVDRAGRPVVNAIVTAIPEKRGNQLLWRSARSDPSGQFRVEGVPDAEHVSCFVLAEGFAAVVRAAPSITTGASAIDVGDIVLPPPSSFAGQVVDESAAPIADAHVEVRRAATDTTIAMGSGADVRSVSLDGQGRFFVGQLQAGAYVMRVWAEHRPPLEDVAITLTEGEQRTDVRLMLVSHLEISGVVLDPDGAPLADAVAYAIREDPADPRTVHGTTDASGKFVLQLAAPGAYELRAFAAEARDADPRATLALAEALVPHVQAGTRDIVLQLPRRASITGVALGPDGKPASLAYVEALDTEQRSLATTLADTQGQFVLHVPAGVHVALRAAWSKENLNFGTGREAIDLDTAPVLAPDVAAGAKDVVLKISTPAPADPK